MPSACPRVTSAFHTSVNMSAAEIRAWAKNPRSREASWESTRRRLPKLAKLKAKARGSWTEADCKYARRVINFNSRMSGMKRVHGCTNKIDVSLRNWGRRICGKTRKR